MIGNLSVSAVIPAYNSAAWLPEAIASVRAQQWPELEIIVVDDGSTDDTQQVIERLRGSDLRCITQPNAGPAAARNAGIVTARGQWIAFLDADDCWLPEKLASQFRAIRQSPAAAFSYTDEIWQGENGSDRAVTRDHRPGQLFFELLWGNRVGTPTVVVRRECFEQVGLFDTALRTGEDWDMWLRLSACFPDAYVARPLTLVRKRPGRGHLDVTTLESCTLRVLHRVFTSTQTHQCYPNLASQRGQVYAWHYSVLAKSYLHQYRVGGFCRLALRTLRSHPAGVRHMAQRHATAPCLATLSR